MSTVVNESSLIPIGTHTRQSLTSGVVETVTATEGASVLIIQADSAAVRITLDNGVTDPTAGGIGFLIDNNDLPSKFYLFPNVSVKVIPNAANAVVNYQWFRPVVR